MRFARVITLAAAASLVVAGCGGPAGPVTYVAVIARFPNLGYVDLIQWVPGHSGKLTGTLTSTWVTGGPHSVRVVTARYGFTGKILPCATSGGCVNREEILLTIRGWQLPDFQTFGPLKAGALKLLAVPEPDGNSPPGTFRREGAAAYYTKLAALRRQVRRAGNS